MGWIFRKTDFTLRRSILLSYGGQAIPFFISELFQNHLRYAQIDYPIILEYDSFGLQQMSLSINTAKRVCSGKLPLSIDHPVTRNMLRIWIVMKNIPHHPGKVSVTQMQSDLPISGNLPPGNVPHKFINILFHSYCFTYHFCGQ